MRRKGEGSFWVKELLENIGHAMLILGSIWLHYVYGLDTVITIGLCVWGLCFWLTSDDKFKNKQKALIDAQIRLIEAKIRHFDNQRR